MEGGGGLNVLIFALGFLVSASAQLLEQTARLKNLSDALDKLKVRRVVENCQDLWRRST